MSKNDYKKLKKIWYAKLKESGFNDIESERFPTGDIQSNKLWTAMNYGSPNSRKAREEYYYLASQFLNEFEFDSLLHKNIWMYHAEAVSYRNIAKILKKVGLGQYYEKHDAIRPLSWHAVRKIVDKYREIMKNRYLST